MRDKNANFMKKKFTKKLVAGAAFAKFVRKRVKHIFLNQLQQILAVKNVKGLRQYDKNFPEGEVLSD